jgi:TRAP-type C4-dicarboxylate transport system substrate-binding protein
MAGMKTGRRLAVLLSLAAASAALVVAGCSGGGAEAENKAGGSGGPVILTLASTNGEIDLTPAVANFVEGVEELSGGNLRINVVNEWGDGAPDAEQLVVRDVSAGKADLGWVGTRVFDTLGANSFQALTAPMLVDSYALENAVIESGMTEEMLAGLDDLDVAGLAVLPDGLRRPASVEGPMLGPADWHGITFGTLMSTAQAEAIRALGARPDQVFWKDREDRLRDGKMQGFETSFWVHQHDPALTALAPYMTSNVTLWPQMDVLLGNQERLDALTDEQRGWLDEAARDAAGGATALADIDAKAASDSCMAGGRFAEASDADVTALGAAFSPVYANLEKNPETKAFIERIQALKASTSPEPPVAVPSNCRGEAPEHAAIGGRNTPAELNGTYRYVLTKEDARKSGETDLSEYPHTNTWILKDGHFSVTGDFGGFTGSYSVDENRITFAPVGSDYTTTFTFTVDDQGNINLDPVPPVDAGDAFEMGSHTVWTKID